jgi:hypothetical protein
MPPVKESKPAEIKQSKPAEPPKQKVYGEERTTTSGAYSLFRGAPDPLDVARRLLGDNV